MLLTTAGRRSGDSSSHSRSSRGDYHRTSGGGDVRERRVERTGHADRKSRHTAYREEKRKGRKRYHLYNVTVCV